MIKLYKKKKADNKTADEDGKKKAQPGELRIQKDLSTLELSDTTKIEFPNGADDIMHFKVNITPDDGFYKDATFTFRFDIPDLYPHSYPKVTCETKCFHPNIDLEGHVCLNILRDEWVPILTINAIIFGLQFLLLEPNPDDPLNKDAAAQLTKDRSAFERIVKSTLGGASHQGERYPRLYK